MTALDDWKASIVAVAERVSRGSSFALVRDADGDALPRLDEAYVLRFQAKVRDYFAALQVEPGAEARHVAAELRNLLERATSELESN